MESDASVTPPTVGSLRLGELLVLCGLVSAADRDQALVFQRDRGGRLGGMLVRMGALSEEALYAALAEQWGVELMLPAGVGADDLQNGLADLPLPSRWMIDRRVLPWRTADGHWHAVSDDLLDADVRESLAARHDVGEVEWHLMLPTDLDRCLAALREGVLAQPQDAQAGWA